MMGESQSRLRPVQVKPGGGEHKGCITLPKEAELAMEVECPWHDQRHWWLAYHTAWAGTVFITVLLNHIWQR